MFESDINFVTGIYDYVFKKLFAEDKKRFTALVELITKEKLEGEMEYGNPSKTAMANSKAIDTDIIATYKSNNGQKSVIVDLEAQCYDMGTRLIRRQFHYASIFLADAYEKNTFYQDERKVIEIFIHKDKTNNGIPISTTLFERSPEGIYYYDIVIYDIYVEEYKRMDFKKLDENGKMMVELVDVLTSEDIDKYLTNKSDLIKGVAKTIMELNKDKNERIKAIKEHYHKQSILILQDVAEERGIAKGKVEGVEEANAKIAKKMKNNGSSVEDIASFLELGVDKVNELLKK